MQFYHYITVLFVWSFYGVYCYSQYNDSIKSTNWYFLIGIGYALIVNSLWILLSKRLGAENTLTYALLWDSGTHLVAFSVPIIVFGDQLKTHTAVGMTFIFIGVSIVLFYEKIRLFF